MPKFTVRYDVVVEVDEIKPDRDKVINKADQIINTSSVKPQVLELDSSSFLVIEMYGSPTVCTDMDGRTAWFDEHSEAVLFADDCQDPIILTIS